MNHAAHDEKRLYHQRELTVGGVATKRAAATVMRPATRRRKGAGRTPDSLCRKPRFSRAALARRMKEIFSMRMIALFALIAAAGAPAMVRRAKPAMPLPPRGMDYVESVCTGGIDGRYEVVRALTNGQVLKMTMRSGGVWHATATRREVAKIMRELDLARFERRVVPPEKPYIMDGIDCSLTRGSNGRAHTVTLMQQMRMKPQYRDLANALDDINELGRRATGPMLRPARQ
jgi:hypothetical protein